VNDTQLQRYSRHILLNELGIEAQNRIRNATVLVVGAGGLGSPALLYLAAAGVGQLVIADGDCVDLTNLQRQIAHTTDRIGQPKVSSVAQTLAALNPDVDVKPIMTRLEGTQLIDQVKKADVVIDCSDNFATRHAINRACVSARVPLVSGAAVRWDGQLSVFNSTQASSPCYHCLFPEGGQLLEERCALMGVFAPLTGLIGTLQAAQALQIIGEFGEPLVGRLLMVDGLQNEFSHMNVSRDPDCKVCSSAPQP
jgi:molybdopterin/thiamine biosynthesis adenylyltransferase